MTCALTRVHDPAHSLTVEEPDHSIDGLSIVVVFLKGGTRHSRSAFELDSDLSGLWANYGTVYLEVVAFTTNGDVEVLAGGLQAGQAGEKCLVVPIRHMC